MPNPLLDFDPLAARRAHAARPPALADGLPLRHGEYIGLPRQSSKCLPDIEQPFDWDNSISVLSPVRPDGKLTTLYRPEGRRLVTDVDLHWDADRLIFSMPGSHGRWQIFEIGAKGGAAPSHARRPARRGQLRRLLPAQRPDRLRVHAPLQGVPCNAA